MDYKGNFDKLLIFMSSNKYSDIHINAGYPINIRNKKGEVINLSTLLNLDTYGFNSITSTEDVYEIVKIIIGNNQNIKDDYFDKEIDKSYKLITGERFRVNIYTDINGYNIAIRIIPKDIPSLETLGLSDTIKSMCDKSKGLILMTGPTGCGKSTNIAAMIDYINQNFQKHIITIEDPVEFILKAKKSLINQREIGYNSESFVKAIKGMLREDPDVILVGEMRDLETIQATLTLAETGHLVFSTLHTVDSIQSIDRIVDVFPADKQQQIRMQLSMSLIGIISQRLLPHKTLDARIPAREVLINNDAIRNNIVKGKTNLLYGILETGSSTGMILMDKYLLQLFKKGLITHEILISYARDPDYVESILKQG